MTKKDLVFNYLAEHIEINWDAIEELKCQPKKSIDLVGGVTGWYLSSYSDYFDECRDAIKYANYKYPDSDRTWRTVDNVVKCIVKEKLSYSKIK